MSLQQELAFYRNMLELSGDPTIGLKLGEPFVPQRYGLFGYALLSAATFRHALTLAENFGRLTFSFYTLKFGCPASRHWFTLSEPPPFEQELVDLYLDRDMSAAQVDFSEVLGEPFPVEEVYLTHDGHGRQRVYREHFGCEVHFSADVGKFVFSSSILDKPLPQSDPESSRHFQQQCQVLIAKLTSQGHFVDDVRMLILARPGFFQILITWRRSWVCPPAPCAAVSRRRAAITAPCSTKSVLVWPGSTWERPTCPWRKYVVCWAILNQVISVTLFAAGVDSPPANGARPRTSWTVGRLVEGTVYLIPRGNELSMLSPAIWE